MTTRNAAPRRRPRTVIGVLTFFVVIVAAGFLFRSFGGDLKQVAGVATKPDQGVALDPTYFASGACMAFAPTAGNADKTVFLDAGHGGIDPGGVGVTEAGQTIDESNVNLGIVQVATALLRARGFRVVVSRTEDTTVLRLGSGDTDGGLLSELGSHDDVAARDVCANLARADVLVGVYMDAGDTADDAGSVTVYDSDRSFSAQNLRLANLLQRDVITEMNDQGWQIPNDGVQSDGSFGSAVGNPSSSALAAQAAAYDHLLLIGPAATGYFSTPSQMPGAVIEPLYLTDPFEGTIAASAADQRLIAQALTSAVEQYFAPQAKAG